MRLVYADSGKPFFNRLEIKGGGDAVSAARAVLQTGDYDYAVNLQVEALVLEQLKQGGKGDLVTAPGAGVAPTAVDRAAARMLEPAVAEHLVEDVIRRVDRRMRIERERRGL